MELDASSKNVVPTRGALVRVPFRGKTGYRILLGLQYRGRPVLFGSVVTLKQKTSGGYPISGIVGEDGQAYLSGMPAGGTVVVNWGNAPDEQCTADYKLPANADKGHPLEVAAVCHS
ncbi:FimD/PapC C-terminal domain-containing protein [Serratia sp. 1D1416]|uniref:FimD/PapC C-terminal domain-containing protein n=1 Tax=Serratia sp. 1D1416 TaxID=2447890 RepID=UPI001F5D3C09|nr:FimD/PapC C-terminal domain-containing protein [Serratia sp. 1D1416]